MSYRFMRIIVMFDLPSTTSLELRRYRKFRNFLIKSGFIMMQESIYTKISLNQSSSKKIIEKIRKNKPEDGLIQVLTVTEKQFSQMEIIVGKVSTDVVNSDERLVIL